MRLGPPEIDPVRLKIHETVLDWKKNLFKDKGKLYVFKQATFMHEEKLEKWHDVISSFWNREKAIAMKDYIGVVRKRSKEEFGKCPPTLDVKMVNLEGKLDEVIDAFNTRVVLNLFVGHTHDRLYHPDEDKDMVPFHEYAFKGFTPNDLAEHHSDLDSYYHMKTMNKWHKAKDAYEELLKHPLGEEWFGLSIPEWEALAAHRQGRLSDKRAKEVFGDLGEDDELAGQD